MQAVNIARRKILSEIDRNFREIPELFQGNPGIILLATICRILL